MKEVELSNDDVSVKKIIGEVQQELNECAEKKEVLYIKMHKVDAKGVVEQTAKGVAVRDVCPMSYEEVCNELHGLKKVAFITFDSFLYEKVELLTDMIATTTVLAWKTARELYVYGDSVDARAHVHANIRVVAVLVSGYLPALKQVVKFVFPFATMDDANTFIEKQKKNTLGKVLRVTGMIMPSYVQRKRTSGSSSEVVYSVYVNEWFIHDDVYADVCALVPKINSYKDLSLFRDLDTGVPLYNWEVNVLLWFNVMYVRLGEPVFNVVLTGNPGVGKTFCLQLYQEMFGKGSVVQSSSGTVKGLLPSFANPVRTGALIDARFFIGVDELFRSPAADAHSQGWKSVTQQTGAYLSKLLPVVTRKQEKITSGNGDIDVMMTAALLATDNMTQETKGALAEIVTRDPAVLRRFLFVNLGEEEEWDNLLNAKIKPSETELVPLCVKQWLDEYGYDVHKLKRVAEWARMKVQTVQVDTVKGTALINEVVRDALKKEVVNTPNLQGVLGNVSFIEKALHKIVLRLHMDAAVRCCAVMRAFFTEKGECLPDKITVQEDDYKEAIVVLQRPVRELLFLFKETIATLVEEGDERGRTGGFNEQSGIRRTRF